MSLFASFVVRLPWWRRAWEKATRQADQLTAQAAAARVVEALKRAYTIMPKPPQPSARADQLPKMGSDR